MSWTPKDSAIKVEQESELESAIASAKSSEEIVALMRDAMIQQRLVTVDTINPDVLYQNEQPQPKGFAKTIIEPSTSTHPGRKLIFHGDTELEMERSIGDYFRNLQTPAAAATEPARDEHGRFVQQPPVILDDAAELASRAATTITEKHLSDLGIDPQALRDMTAQTFTQSWADAAEQFRQTNGDWVGGDANKDTLGRLVAENGLDSPDKVLALAAAWKFMKENNLVVENPEVAAVQTRDEEIAACTTQQELDACVAKWYPNSRGARTNQQLFDR